MRKGFEATLLWERNTCLGGSGNYPGNCGGTLTILAAILDPTAIAKILTHLSLPIRAPPRAPARHFALLQTA